MHWPEPNLDKVESKIARRFKQLLCTLDSGETGMTEEALRQARICTMHQALAWDPEPTSSSIRDTPSTKGTDQRDTSSMQRQSDMSCSSNFCGTGGTQSVERTETTSAPDGGTIHVVVQHEMEGPKASMHEVRSICTKMSCLYKQSTEP